VRLYDVEVLPTFATLSAIRRRISGGAASRGDFTICTVFVAGKLVITAMIVDVW
jgi:hypothetical protein